MRTNTAAILGAVGTLAAVIWLYIAVIPAKKDGKLNNKFLQILHNIFNFKSLLIEKILKLCYVFSTCFVIISGFFMLFSTEQYSYGYYSRKESMAIPGLLLMVVGPIVLRLAYEAIMMFIILVKKVISIDNKIKNPEEEKNAEQTPEPVIVGYDPNTGAPHLQQSVIGHILSAAHLGGAFLYPGPAQQRAAVSY